MKIGVVSDTHLSRSAASLPRALTEEFSQVDIILHLGDWVAMEIYDMLSQLAPVEGIAGNNDGYDIIQRFGERKIVTLEGMRIGMVHGHAPIPAKGRMAMRCWLLKARMWTASSSAIPTSR